VETPAQTPEPNLSHRAYEHLRRKLISGELAAGARLSNRQLAHEIGVSFTPVREAINRLASEGLVEYVRGSGAFVKRPDPDDIAQIYDLREALEPFAAAQAARHITPAELEQLKSVCDDWLAIVRGMREDGGDHAATLTEEQLQRWVDDEERFHGLVIHAARNRWLAKIAHEMRFLLVSFQFRRAARESITFSSAAHSWREHLVLVRLLGKGDGPASQAWMAEHIRLSRENMMNYLARR
jgi:DNA-binding GntR family transcriptional regulator